MTHNIDQKDPDLAWEEELKNQRFLEKWQKRYGDLPWLDRHKPTRKISGVASYIFNVASVIGLWYAVNVLIGPFLPVPYLSEVITTGLLVLFEITKRKFSDLFWDYWHKHLRLNLLYGAINFIVLFGISLVGSGFGVYFGVTDTSAEAKQVGVNDDPEAISLQEEIAEIDDKIEQHRNNTTSDGTIYWPSQKAIEKLEAQRLENKEILKTKYGIYQVKNETILQEWKLRKDFRAYFIIALTILMEFFFECCMSFNSKYDYRRGLRVQKALQASSPTPPTGGGGGGRKMTTIMGDRMEQFLQELEREAQAVEGSGPRQGPSSERGNSVATLNIDDAEIYDYARKYLRSKYNAFKSNSSLKDETRARHMQRIQTRMDLIDQQLQQLQPSA